MKHLIYRSIRFIVAGTIAAIFYFALLTGMVELIGVPIIYATLIAYPIVTIENYLVHHLWTFKSSERHGYAFPRFIITAAVGFFINWLIMYIGVEVLNLHYIFVQATSMCCILAFNLIIGSLWIFGGQTPLER